MASRPPAGDSSATGAVVASPAISSNSNKPATAADSSKSLSPTVTASLVAAANNNNNNNNNGNSKVKDVISCEIDLSAATGNAARIERFESQTRHSPHKVNSTQQSSDDIPLEPQAKENKLTSTNSASPTNDIHQHKQNKNKNQNQQQQQQQQTTDDVDTNLRSSFRKASLEQAEFSSISNNKNSAKKYTDNNYQENQHKRARKLSYVQSLLLVKWPYLAGLICIMASLMFSILISTLTVYLLHSASSGDCNALAKYIAAIPETHPLSADLRRLEQDERQLGSNGGNGEPLLYSSISSALGSASKTSSSPSAGGESKRREFRRLPKSVKPIHYELYFAPTLLPPFTYNGSVQIDLICDEETKNITLNANELSIDQKSLTLKPKQLQNDTSQQQEIKITNLKMDKRMQLAVIEFDEYLKVGQHYVLNINFIGSLNDDLAGFYKMKYKQTNSKNVSETIWIAATQFEPTDARRAFPCFDEPALKATFGIQIKHLKNMTALSNMPIIDSKESSDALWVTDTFAKSAKMSTYLVAFTVTNFESRREGNIAVWTRPGLSHTAEYSLRIASKILHFYEQFFGVEFPLPKMDMIALPEFSAGAMENWGLITYRETAMLYDERTSSVISKCRVASVVAHELAHQWFGNLVTPKWWDDLWLNEGFATYVEYLGVNHVEPLWRIMDWFVIDDSHDVLKLDALSSSHQISVPVNDPDEISEIFDRISYGKGSSVIRMMSTFLTEPIFKRGMRQYLSALRYANAEQSDLWAHLTEAQKSNSTPSFAEIIDVGRVMNSWTLQRGFPLVTLTRNYDAQEPEAYLNQKPFAIQKGNVTDESIEKILATLLSSTKDVESKDKLRKWEVPVSYTWKSESSVGKAENTTKVWLHQDEQEKLVKLNSSLLPAQPNEWVVVNVDQVGFYRVNYDSRNWDLIVDQLFTDHRKIRPVNRAQLIDDMFVHAQNSILDYKFVLNATRYLRAEFDHLPWQSAITSFDYISCMLHSTSLYGPWRTFLHELVEPFYSRYKNFAWTVSENSQASNDFGESWNFANSVSMYCKVNKSCKAKAKAIFDEFKTTKVNRINTLLRPVVYCSAIELGDEQDWNFLLSIYEKEQSAVEKQKILRALACSREPWLLQRYLEMSLDKEKTVVRRQDATHVFSMIAHNQYQKEVARKFFWDNWKRMRGDFGSHTFSKNMIKSIASSMNTRSELKEFILFYDSVKDDVGSAKREFEQSIEEIRANIAWMENNYSTLSKWLSENYKSKQFQIVETN